MADQKISELQLVVATGITPTGVYMPLYTPMMSPQNRRMSVPELFKSPPRLEVKDTSVAGSGEIATLTTSYGTASLRVGTGGQFIVGGDVAAFASFIEKGGDVESLAFIDQVTQAAPLVRADYLACREAVKTLEEAVPKGGANEG